MGWLGRVFRKKEGAARQGEGVALGALGPGGTGRGANEGGASRPPKGRGPASRVLAAERGPVPVSSGLDVLVRPGAGLAYGATDGHLDLPDGFNALHAPLNVGIEADGMATARRAIAALEENGRLDSETAELVLRVVEQERLSTHAALLTQYATLRGQIAVAEKRALAVRLEELPRRAEEIRARLAEIEGERAADGARAAGRGAPSAGSRARDVASARAARPDAAASGRPEEASPGPEPRRRPSPGFGWGRGPAESVGADPLGRDAAAAAVSA